MEEEISIPEISIPETGNNKPNKTSTVPAADLDFGKVVKAVSDKWVTSPWLTLQWVTQPEFTTSTNAYRSILTQRLQSGSLRPQTTAALKAVSKKIDDSLAHVKGYLNEKYGKEIAKSYYPAFGIIHTHDAYIFPADQNNRSEALALMITGIATNGFGAKDYGTVFWTDIQTQYNTLLVTATSTDGEVSSKVGNKNILKKELKKALNSIILTIRGNYPDNYKQELRLWGFQKEKY